MNFGLMGFLGLAFFIFILFFIFKQIQFFFTAVNLYKGMNERLDRIIALLSSNPAVSTSVSLPSANSPNAHITLQPPSAPKQNEQMKRETRLRILAESIRDNPRIPVDEKIELIQLLGGKFSWEKGSNCKVEYKGTEHSFPSGKEFGQWLNSTVLSDVLQTPSTDA